MRLRRKAERDGRGGGGEASDGAERRAAAQDGIPALATARGAPRCAENGRHLSHGGARVDER